MESDREQFRRVHVAGTDGLASVARWTVRLPGHHRDRLHQVCVGGRFHTLLGYRSPAWFRFDGFFVGRFDIRYGDVERFKAGTDVAIVELNGATAESTNIYDPQTTLFDAYGQLFRQWSIVFSIGAANRAAGAPVASHRRLFDLVRAHLRATEPFPVSD